MASKDKSHQDDNHSSTSTKVKIYYTFRGSTSTRLATFQMTIQHNDHDTSLVTLSLKDCLWAICSSSPDMICHEHDLSVYTANFQESQNHRFIWEGHGLMSWVMEEQHTQNIHIYGKLHASTQHIEVYMELQPTLKWCKTEFYNALQSQDFEGFKQTPSSSCNCGIYAALCTKQQKQQHQQQQQKEENDLESSKRRRLTPPPTPLPSTLATSPTLPPISVATRHPSPFSSSSPSSSSPPSSSSSFSSSSSSSQSSLSSVSDSIPKLPPPSGLISSPPYSSFLFRPEPLLPEITHRRSCPSPQLPWLDDNHHHHHKQQQQHQYHQRYHHSRYPNHHLPLPLSPPSFKFSRKSNDSYPPTEPSRSAFTATSQYPSPPSSTNSNIPATSIPVIYTPSNKKRKKYPPVIMPADNKKSSTRPHRQRSPMQQVSTSVRTYYEVDRDGLGQYILPVEIDSWTVVDLGTVVYDRPAYHNQRYVYPVNYTVRKWYRSMVDAKSDTQYTCRILDNGREPKFEVTADDCPMTYSGPTPTTVWTIIVRRAFAIRNQEYGHNPVGPDFFGLRKNTIAKMIQDLPNVDKCSQYVWQTFEPARFNKPGRNRRRLDTMISGSILGGVNYSLTSGRLNTVASHQQHQLQIQQRRLSSAMGVTGTIEAAASPSSSSTANDESSAIASPTTEESPNGPIMNNTASSQTYLTFSAPPPSYSLPSSSSTPIETS